MSTTSGLAVRLLTSRPAGYKRVVYLRLVGAVEQAVVQQEGGAVRGERVALHLSEAHAAAAPPPLHGLPRQRVHRARRADLTRGVVYFISKQGQNYNVLES